MTVRRGVGRHGRKGRAAKNRRYLAAVKRQEMFVRDREYRAYTWTLTTDGSEQLIYVRYADTEQFLRPEHKGLTSDQIYL